MSNIAQGVQGKTSFLDVFMLSTVLSMFMNELMAMWYNDTQHQGLICDNQHRRHTALNDVELHNTLCRVTLS